MSLRARLLAGTALVSLVLVVAGVVVVRTTESYLVDRVDAQLAAALGPARAFGGGEAPPPANQGPGGDQTLNSLYVARIDDGQVTVVARPQVSSAGSAVPTVPVARAVAAADGSENFTVDATGGAGSYRMRASRLPDGGVIVVGLSLHDVDSSVHRLVLVEVGVVAAVIAILGLVVFWVLHLGVRPIKRMTRTAGAIAAGDLSQRVPAGAPGTESAELGDALNTMMTRIEEAFGQRAESEARLRRFVADASHELRTPVTTIRGYAELYRHGGLAEPDDLGQAMRRTEQESIRMATLIDDLLLLARLDEGRPFASAPVDLGVLGVDAAADARAVDPGREVVADVAEGVVVAGDEHRLRQVLANLVGNALVHTPAESRVTVRVRGGGDHAVLEVEDAGPGMAPDVVERAFERFSRADPSRSRHRGGSGLGLAIVAAIVDAHGGAVSLVSDPTTGTTVQVVLPLTPSPPPAAPDLPDPSAAAAGGS